MGMIYRKKYKKPDGSVFEGRVWWIKYYRSGRPFRESSGSTKETVAKQLLKLREGDIVRGVPVTPRANRCTVRGRRPEPATHRSTASWQP